MVTVTAHGPATSLDVDPDAATIAVGQTQAYTATASDDYGNVWDVTGDTVFASVAGSFAGSVLTGENVGIEQDVVGTYEGLTDTVVVTVTAGALDYIVISPDTATITAGDSQAYTAEAFDQHGNSLGDVTSSTAFSIEAGAGGSWSVNIYTSEHTGTWTVTGEYSGKTDTATLMVTAGGGGVVGAPAEVVRYFTVDFLGKITKEPISGDGRLLSSLEAPSPDGAHLFEMEDGTRTLDDEGEVVTLIEIREIETPSLPGNTVVVGKAYDFTPSGDTFDRPTSITLVMMWVSCHRMLYLSPWPTMLLGQAGLNLRLKPVLWLRLVKPLAQ